MTDYEIEQLAHRTCWRYKVSKDPNHSDTYTFNRHTLLEFARALHPSRFISTNPVPSNDPTTQSPAR